MDQTRRRRPRATEQTQISSSSHGPNPRSPAPAGARVRQSVLYSDRPRVEEHVGEVSREFEALTLDQSPPTPDTARRVEENAGMASGSEGPAGDLPEFKALALNVAPSKPELSDREEWRKLKEYKETMFDKDFAAQSTTLAASCDKNSAVEHVTEYSGAAEWARRAYATQNKSLLDCLNAQRTMAASSKDEPRCKVSDKDIIQNGKKWMIEEVMVAFNEYIGKNDKLKKLKYRFEELRHQCFNIECYFKIFHHFNFTVKTKFPSSDDWKLRTYFAEVKEIFGEKFYFCCPLLESNENGQCYACSNQGVKELRHPATGGFERGLPDTVFPYM